MAGKSALARAKANLPCRYIPKLSVVAQLFQSKPQTPLYGAQRQALCYLHVRQLGEVAEREDLALLVGELLEGSAHQVSFEVAPSLGEGLVGLGRGSVSLDLLPRAAASRAGAELVYCPIADDGEEPGPDAATSYPVATGGAPHLDERFLDQILCWLPLVHETVGQRVGGADVAVVEQGERLGIAIADEVDQVLVGEEQVASCVVPHTVRLELLSSASRLLASSAKTASR